MRRHAMNKDGKNPALVAASCMVAALALVLAVVALLREPGGDGLNKELQAATKKVETLEADVAKLSSEMGGLPAKVDKLDARVAQLAKRKESGEEAIRNIVGERIRDQLLRRGRNVRLRPGDVPQEVKAAARKVVAGIEVLRAEQKAKDGRSYFKLKGRLGGEDYDLRIWADGEVIKAEMPPHMAPQVIRDAAARAVEGIRLTEVEQKTRDGETVYEVEGKVGKKKYDIKISAEGRVLEIDGPEGKKKMDAEGGEEDKPGQEPPAGDKELF
jgi:uncharacterized membrane protein YkoI